MLLKLSLHCRKYNFFFSTNKTRQFAFIFS